MRLRVHPKAYPKACFKNNLTEVLQSGIIRLVSEMVIFGDEDENADSVGVEPFLRAVVAGELPQLKAVSIWCCDLSQASFGPELIAEAVVNLKECDLGRTDLPTGWRRAILDKIIEAEHMRLGRLLVSFRESEEIPGEILMKAAVKLEYTNIYEKIKDTEKPEWFKFIAESPIMNMKHIEANKFMSNVTPDDLAAALVRVEKVVAWNLSKAQSRALLNKIASGEDIKLRKLMFRATSDVPPEVLALGTSSGQTGVCGSQVKSSHT